jgi:hypothetical protein
MTIGSAMRVRSVRCLYLIISASTLTPGFPSEATGPAAAAAAPPLDPAVTTSRRELPIAVVPATRRFFPLTVLPEPAPIFSFVLEASDRESSAG